MATNPDVLASRRLRAYLYAAYRRIGGIAPKTLQNALGEEFPPGYPPLLREKRAQPKTTGVLRDHGYYAAANALWMTRSYLKGKTRNDKTFDDGNERDIRVREIIRSELDAWLNGQIDLRAAVQHDPWLHSATRVDLSTLPHLGVPVVGYRAGVIWLTATRDRMLLKEPEPARRSVLIQRLVEPLPVNDEYRWVHLVPPQWSPRILADSSPDKYAGLAKDVVRYLFDVPSSDTPDAIELFGLKTYGTKTGVFGLLSTAARPSEMEGALAAVLHAQQERIAAIDWVIVATTVGGDDAQAILRQLAIEKHLSTRMLVVDPAVVGMLMGACPWLWGASAEPATLTIDRGGAGQDDEFVNDPRLPEAIRSEENVLIIGGAGSGKTAALRKLVRMSTLEAVLLKRGLEVVIHARDGSPPAPLIEQLVSDFLERGWRLIVGVDDADHLHDTSLVAALARLQHRHALLRLVVTVSNAHALTEYVTRVGRPFHSIVLDGPSRFFLSEIAMLSAKRHHVKADPLEIFQLVEYLLNGEAATPRNIVTAIKQAANRTFTAPLGRTPLPDPVAAVATWRAESHGRTHYRLLQAVAVLADLGIPHVPPELILGWVAAVMRQPIAEFVAPWEEIVGRKVVQFSNGQVITGSLVLPFPAFGLWVNSDPFPWRLRIWLFRHADEVLSPTGRWTFLFHLWTRYWAFEHRRQARRVYNRFAALFPYDLALDKAIGMITFQSGEAPPQEIIASAARRAPAPPELLLLHYFQRRDYIRLADVTQEWLRARPEWFADILRLFIENGFLALLADTIRGYFTHHESSSDAVLAVFQASLTVALFGNNTIPDMEILSAVPSGNERVARALNHFAGHRADASFQTALSRLKTMVDADPLGTSAWATPEGQTVRTLMAELEQILAG